ncbi:lipid A biosynthesis acyltransferase [Apibacter muscae]|uniref:Lipid A biosynthesis acyltransferase n=1 Tax=Apibacter muscae TaxID=2509004 RepID=A0A563D7L5_9FLAO|nr:lipid A biosynthesis acyltransferase [Apibacter muscae]TWP26087.1 lipid A biosynthesis acyltransferase [Apibacter muscae]
MLRVLANITIKIISFFPLKLLYGISSILYFIIYYILRYRKKIVRHNINIAFPNKNSKEKQIIEKNFYKNFTDFIIEFIKIFSMTQQDFNKHISIKNLEILEKSKKENKDVILLAGHLFNWEWLIGVSKQLPQNEAYAVYKKVANGFFDFEVFQARSKFGTIPLSVKDATRKMIGLPNDGTHAYLFVADQSPYKTRIHYELEFFNRLTPVFNGYDKIARKKNYHVFYLEMNKIYRGKYEVVIKSILPDQQNFRENEIVEKFYQNLNHNIIKHSALWLWSHKRWKYTSGIDYKL